MEFLTHFASATVLTSVVYIFGGWDVALQCLLIFVVIDYVTGMIKAGIRKEWNSTLGFKGILKKIGILTLIAVAAQIDVLTNMNGVVRTLVIYYFVANEGLSILENLAQSGVPIPEFLKSKLIKLKEDSDNGKMEKSK